METDNKQESKVAEKEEANTLSFLQVDKLVRKSHAFSLLLKTNDIIIGLNGLVFRGTQKIFNQKLKEDENRVLTVLRKGVFINIKATGPLGIKLIEVGSDETEDLLLKAEEHFKEKRDFTKYNEFEVYRGKNNYYDIIEKNDSSLLASLLPFVWFFHHRLYSPMLLLTCTFLLLGSIAWWLVLAAWVITTVYMSKSSMSLLRGYCLFHEMRLYMKLYCKSNIEVQNIIRDIDKKSRYRFQLIDLPHMDDNKSQLIEEENKNITKEQQATA